MLLLLPPPCRLFFLFRFSRCCHVAAMLPLRCHMSRLPVRYSIFALLVRHASAESEGDIIPSPPLLIRHCPPRHCRHFCHLAPAAIPHADTFAAILPTPFSRCCLFCLRLYCLAAAVSFFLHAFVSSYRLFAICPLKDSRSPPMADARHDTPR